MRRYVEHLHQGVLRHYRLFLTTSHKQQFSVSLAALILLLQTFYTPNRKGKKLVSLAEHWLN